MGYRKIVKKKKIRFYEKSHIYKLGSRKLTSVTSWISKYFEPFDVTKIAKIKAFMSKRAGIKGQGVRYWKALWKQSAIDGTNTHWLLEQEILELNNKGYVPEDCCGFGGHVWKKYAEGTTWLFDNFTTDELKNAIPEKIIYNEELGLAGMIDLIIERDGELYLVDYKTNKAIHKNGYRGKKAKSPISELDDCNYSKYILQLNIYAHMLKLQGYKIGGMILLHLKEDGAEEINIPKRFDLVEKLIEDDKKEKD